MAELARVFPVLMGDGQDGHGHGLADDQIRPGEADTLATRLVAAEARLTDAQDQIADLRHRLDEANAERRQTADRLAAAQERIAALLTDQRQAAPAQIPARRKRWPWSRG
jgi:chromosome segregation ATPase